MELKKKKELIKHLHNIWKFKPEANYKNQSPMA